MRTVFFITLCIVTFTMASPVLAATYYVDATNGNDRNDGLSPEKAWQTVKKVKISQKKPGDQFLFKRGEVFSDGILFVYASGEEGNPIIFKDYGDPQKPLPVITYKHNFCIWMRDQAFLTFQNLHLAGGGEAVVELKQSAVGKTHDIIVKDCIIRGRKPQGTGVWVDTAVGGLVEGCDISECGTGFSSHDPGFTVRNCKIHDNVYGVSVGTYDTLIEGNEIYNNDVGIRYGFGYGKSDVTFRRNLVRDNKKHGFETWYGVVDTGRLYYNIFARNGGDGIFLKNGVSGIDIFNNVIYGNGGHGIHLAVEKDAAPRNILINNNIIMDNKGFAIKVAKGVSGLISDYNCVYGPVPASLTEWHGTANTWEDWKRHSQQDAHSINQDPLFADKSSGNFKLTVDSPCSNAGVDTGVKGEDYYGNPVPSGTFDIGVHERQAAEPAKSKVPAGK